MYAGPKMVPSISEVIGDRSMLARRYAISALGLLRQEDALPALIGIASDKTEKDYFRSDALEAITVIDMSEGQAIATEMLEDEDLPDFLRKTALLVSNHPERIPTEWERH